MGAPFAPPDPIAIGMGFPPGVPMPTGRVTRCGDGIHAIKIGVDGSGGETRCDCGRLKFAGSLKITGAPGQSVVILSPDRIYRDKAQHNG